jgi:hypothetical protein
MAKGRKTGGRDFLPANTANLNGRPKTPEEIKLLQNYTKSEINRVFHALINGDTSQCFQVKHNPQSTILEQGIAKVLESFALYGDVNKFNALAAHCGLAVSKTAELTKIGDEPTQQALTKEEATKMLLYIRELKKERERQEKLVVSTDDKDN